MRLLYVIDSLAPGGAEMSLLEMTPGLVASGIDLHVLPLGARLDLVPALEGVGASVHTPVHAGRGRLRNVQSVLDSVRVTRPDLIHTTLFEADVAGRTAARIAKIPASTSIVGETYAPSRRTEVAPYRLRLARTLDQLTSRHASRFHAVSTSLAKSCTQSLRVPSDRIDIIPRGRDPRSYPFRPHGVRAAVRASLNIDRDAPVILAVGRLDAVKGLTHLMRALPSVTAAHPRLVVVVAGKHGDQSADLRRQAAGLGTDIRLLGHRNDVARLLAAADLLCFPSLREGSPGTLIEALAVGCPVVASDIAPNREVLGVADQSVGLLTTTGDHLQLAAALLYTLEHPGKAAQLAERGRSRFDEHYTIEAIVPRMREFFVAASGGPATTSTTGGEASP